MIKTGKDHLEQLRDGRVVFIGDEKVSDVTKHPSLKRAAALFNDGCFVTSETFSSPINTTLPSRSCSK